MRRRSEGGVWWANPYVAGILALVPTVLGIFLIIHELTLHDVLGGVTLQQGGVNFASSVALSKGQLPYENFVLTQPPGMSILLLPFAWGAHSSAAPALDAARGLTALVSVVDVFLVGLTARFHGTASTFIAGVLFATFPNAFYATSSVTLEPFLLLFCLLAFQAAFTHGQIASGGRLILAGVLIGFAVAIKPWAIIPVVVILVCAAFVGRAAVGRVIAGVVIGIGVPCIIFVLASPSAFFRDVVSAELSRGGGGHGASAGFGVRVAEILGLGSPLGLSHPSQLALAIGAVIVVLVLVAAIARFSVATPLDWALLATVVGLAAIALVPESLPPAFTWFLAAFGAIVLGNAVGSLLSLISSVSVGSTDTTSTVAGGMTLICVAAMVAVVSIGVPKETDYWRAYFLQNGSNPAAAIDAVVPRGACVVSNNPEALVIAGRFTELPTGCPYVVDPDGIQRVAQLNNAVNVDWEQLLGEARYVVIAPVQPSLLNTPELNRYFTRNFTLVTSGPYSIYENTGSALP